MPKNPEAKALVEQAIAEIKKKKEFDKDAGGLLASMEEGLVKAIGPALERVISQMEKSIKGVKMDAPNIEMPSMELDMGPVAEAISRTIKESMAGVKINVPEVKLPTINVPEMKMPAINIPPQSISEVALKGVGTKSPLPVIMYGLDGKPSMQMVGGGSKANFLTIKGMLTANGDTMVDDTNDALRVNIVAGSSSGTQYTEGDSDTTPTGTAAMGMTDAGLLHALRLGSGVSDKALRVVHAVDVATSVNVVGFTASVAVVITTDDGDSAMDETNDALRVNVVAGSLNANTEYNDGATPDQAGGTGILDMIFDGGSAQSRAGSSYGVALAQLAGFDGSLVGITNNALDVNIGANSVETKQVSGTVSSVEIASQPFTLDVKQLSGTSDSVSVINSVEVKQVSGFENSVNISSIGGNAVNAGAGAVGTGTLRVVVANDTTTMVVGNVVADAADDGSGPVKIGGIARTANPTAVAGNDRVSATYDDLGRQVMRINQVRDLMQTAYATLSNGTETTLLAGASGVFHDLVYVMGANDSDAAVQVDLRAATAANKVMTIEIPARGTAGVSLPTPLPQDVAADTWTADMPDITGTNVYLSALFSKEV